MAGSEDGIERPGQGGSDGAFASPSPLLPHDPLVERARPAFLYVMYALLLWSLPMGWIAAWRPHVAAAMTRGMAAYLLAIPEPLYALFGTGYLGYTVARSWAAKGQGGKAMER